MLFFTISGIEMSTEIHIRSYEPKAHRDITRSLGKVLLQTEFNQLSRKKIFIISYENARTLYSILHKYIASYLAITFELKLMRTNRTFISNSTSIRDLLLSSPATSDLQFVIMKVSLSTRDFTRTISHSWAHNCCKVIRHCRLIRPAHCHSVSL